MLTRVRAVVLAVAGLSLAACGNVHPGSAAVVDGKTISMKTLDETAQAYCTLTLNAAQQQGGAVQAISNADIRRQAVVALATSVVAEDLAKREDLDVRPSAWEVTPSMRDQLAKAFPNANVDELARAIEEDNKVSVIAIALAAKRTGQAPSEANQQQLLQIGRDEITKAFASEDVKFAPRFGLSPSGQVRSDTGSISVAPVDLEATPAEELPDTQRCS
ncbi:hypothetical protein GEV29_08125 [Aeromicrobium sp. SMF47]|uniref:hypothetical protein n=1 Tax=Aeromicrobium yanjiei TaxID=2662028 RepID=UPI00129EAB75|nr:hypothetical protein [Aeromicrobium yanjiei]MRJ76498.1 hypothetical protein [Aeromicrobium yanjiei]